MTDSAILRTVSKVPYGKYIDTSFVSPLYVKHTAVKPDIRSLVNGVSEQFDSNITYNILSRKMYYQTDISWTIISETKLLQVL